MNNFRSNLNIFFKFLLSGAGNTLITYLLYLALLNVWSYRISYTITFCVGIIISYAFNRFFVFKAQGGWHTFLFFPLIYIFQYIAGFALVILWVEFFRGSVFFAPVAAVAITIPMTFILTRQVFKEKKA
jgi:putative flippase GtrA